MCCTHKGSPCTRVFCFRYLLSHITELGSIASETVAALNLLTQEPSVLLLDHSTPTLIALQQMHEQGISAAAIQAPGNSMVANLSMSDLRYCLCCIDLRQKHVVSPQHVRSEILCCAALIAQRVIVICKVFQLLALKAKQAVLCP